MKKKKKTLIKIKQKDHMKQRRQIKGKKQDEKKLFTLNYFTK